jgi:nicastrin
VVNQVLNFQLKIVWSTFSSDISSSDTKPIIFITSKLDSNALVHDFAYGSAGKSGVACVMAVMEALSNTVTPVKNLNSTFIFALFDAEMWGFAGSKRFVKDITTPFICIDDSQTGTIHCPYNSAGCVNPCHKFTDFTKINFEMISSIIDFDTIGFFQDSSITNRSILNIHVDDISVSKKLASSFLPVNLNSMNLSFKNAFNEIQNNRLPPSSSMAFLSRKKIPTIVISDYTTEFSNKYYSSEYDSYSWNEGHLNVICAAATSTARSIYTTAGGVSPSKIQANCSLVYLYIYN